MFGFDIFAIVFVALVILTLFAGVKTVRKATIGRSSGSAATCARCRPA